MYTKRIDLLLKAAQAGIIYITSPENLWYYSGFTGGEGALVLTSNERLLFTDSRYLLQAAEEAPDFTVTDVAKTTAAAYLADKKPEAVAYEGDDLSASAYEALQKQLSGTVWQSLSREILQQRAVKDEREQALTRQAAALADEAFAHVLPMLRPDVTERDIALELEWYMRKNGASAASFPIICASGPRSALPHGIATDKRLAKGDFVTLDFGCFLEGYASDMTRTVVMGKASSEQRRIYETVLRAQEAALACLAGGAAAKAVDAAARGVIENAGYGEYFGHALGHGTGLMIHERPVLSPKSEDALMSGMITSIEPGIYIEGLGGVRIEDLVIITENGYENLTRSPKELLELS